VLIAACTSNGIAAYTRQATPSPTPLAQFAALPDFSALAARVGPSVVNISTDRMVSTDTQSPLLVQNDPFFQFFKRFQFKLPREPGDVVLALNGERVGSVKQLRHLVDKSSKHVALLLKRDQGTVYVAINLG
jgi:S1-C subfamily serine protease